MALRRLNLGLFLVPFLLNMHTFKMLFFVEYFNLLLFWGIFLFFFLHIYKLLLFFFNIYNFLFDCFCMYCFFVFFFITTYQMHITFIFCKFINLCSILLFLKECFLSFFFFRGRLFIYKF